MNVGVADVWLCCRARTTTSILEWKVIKEYGMEVGIYDEKDVSTG